MVNENNMQQTVKNNNGEEFPIVNAADYIQQLKNNNAETVVAKKSGCIIARKVTSEKGEDIQVYTNDGNHEATEHADKGKWIVSKADINTGKAIIDEHGNTNTWSMDDETINKKYDIANMDESGFVKPKGDEQTFIKTDKDIAILVPWGKDRELIPQTLKKDSYLNITNPKKVYGIARNEFAETYQISKEPIETMNKTPIENVAQSIKKIKHRMDMRNLMCGNSNESPTSLPNNEKAKDDTQLQ